MPIDYDKISRYEQAMIRVHGNDKNIYIAQFLSLKARKMQMSEGADPELILANL